MIGEIEKLENAKSRNLYLLTKIIYKKKMSEIGQDKTHFIASGPIVAP